MLKKIVPLASCVIAILLMIGFSWFSGIPSPTVAPTRAINENPAELFANDDENVLAEIKFVCDNSIVRPVWIDLLEEKKFTNELFRSKLQKEYDCSEMLQTAELDLNDDGSAEHAIRVQNLGVCNPTDNCPIAFYGIFDDEKSKMRTSAGIYDSRLRRLLFQQRSYELRNRRFQDL